MFKKLLLAVVTFVATMGFAFAEVDVNKADQAALDSVKGIGPKISKTIVDERKKGGDFKDWADFEKRVKGIGDKSAAKLSDNGLTVNGQSLPKTGAGKEDKKSKQAKAAGSKEERPAASESKDAKAGDTKEMKKDAKKGEAKK